MLSRTLKNYLKTFQGLTVEVWFLALVTLINRAGTMVIPFLALYLSDALGFTLEQVAWIMTFYGIGSFIGSWLGGKLTDTIGYFPVMYISLIGTGIFFICLQFINTFTGFCIAITIIMIVADVFRPASMAAINSFSKKKNRTRSLTLIRLAINLGFSLGPAAGGIIIFGLGYLGLFWIDGITCIIAAMLIIYRLRPKKTVIIEEETTETEEAINISNGSPYKDRTFWMFLLVTFLIGFAFMQLFSTIPLYYRNEYELNEKLIGLLMALNGVIILIFEMPLVSWFERRGITKLRTIQIASLLIALSFFVYNVADWGIILIISMVFVTVGEMLAFPFANSIVLDRAPKARVGEYLALFAMSFSVSHIVVPNVGLQLAAKFGYDVCWIVMGAVCLLAIVIAQPLKKRLLDTNN